MNKYLKDTDEYLKTAGLTFLLSIILVSMTVIDLALNIQDKKEIALEQIQLQNQRLELQRLYYLEKVEKNNYMINLKIAILHETLKEFNQAEDNYEKAMQKSNNNPFVLYRLSLFFIAQKQYNNAIELINHLPNIEDKKIYTIKAKFYSRLAQSFLEDKDPTNAVKTYKIAYKYARNSDKKLKEETAKKLASAYDDLADTYINANDPKAAIIALQNALDIYADPLAKYKLALIYNNVDNEKSLKYIEEAYRLNPDIINLDIYNEILNKLIKKSKDQGDYSKLKFYTLKLDRLKRKIIAYHIFKGDLDVLHFQILTKRKFFIGDKETFAKLKIKNNTKNSTENLYLKIYVKLPAGALYGSEGKVITSSSLIKAQESQEIQMKLEPNKLAYQAVFKHADVEIYAKKTRNAPWVMIEYLAVDFFN